MLLYILLCSVFPFHGDHEEAITRAILCDGPSTSSLAWRSLTPEAKDCVKRMLVSQVPVLPGDRCDCQMVQPSYAMLTDWCRSHQ